MSEIIFSGPEGRIEGRYHQSEEVKAPVAVVLHPHPQHGGTMNNKVAYKLYHAFARNGFSVLRFNFRGVGRSEGEFDNGVGELSDATAALDWLQANNPNTNHYWVGGFSFGSWIGMQLLMRRPELEGFVSISPPAAKYDFNFLSPCPSNGLVVQGDQDSIVNVDDVTKLVEKLNKQKNTEVDYHIIEGADHFFRGQLDELDTRMDAYLQDRLKNGVERQRRVRPDRRRRPLQA